MKGNSAPRSILASNMPPTAVFAIATSFTSSAAAVLCLNRGLVSGDSRIGSIGSRGLIRWAKMHSLGSAISSMLREFWAVFVCRPFSGVGGGIGNWNKENKVLNHGTLKVFLLCAICKHLLAAWKKSHLVCKTLQTVVVLIKVLAKWATFLAQK